MDDDEFEVIKQLGKDGAQGVVYLVEFNNGLRAAMKQFKKTKSSARIKVEAEFQEKAFDAGIAPEVMHVDLENKRIFMEPMQCRLVDVLKRTCPQFEDDLAHIMQTLDDIDILHNDGNALNLMLDDEDQTEYLEADFNIECDKQYEATMYPAAFIALSIMLLVSHVETASQAA